MRILHISDIHYRSHYQGTSPYQKMLSCMDNPLQNLQAMLKEAASYQPIDLLAVTGDLCDDGTEADYQAVRQMLDAAEIPWEVCLGNHDHKAAFNHVFLNQDSNVPYLHWSKLGIYTVVSFDNSLFNYPNGYLDEVRLSWLDHILSKEENVILLMHHQLNDMPGIPSLTNKEKLLEILYRHPPVLLLNGHTHWCHSEKINGIPCMTAPSVSFRGNNLSDGSVAFYQTEGYRIYDLNETGINDFRSIAYSNAEPLMTMHS